MSKKRRLHTKKPKKVFIVIAALALLNVALALFLFLDPLSYFKKAVPAEDYPELSAVNMKTMTFDEVTSYLGKIAQVKGAVYAFEILKRADLPRNIDTHLVAHTIGDVLYKQKGAEGIQYCTQDFRNACSHSIVIGVFLHDGDKALAKLSAICKNAPGGKGAYGMCFHGLGHGVLAYKDYEMTDAVAMCQRLSDPSAPNPIEARECVGGTMMEMASGVHDPKTWLIQSKKYLTDDPLSPCDMDFIPSFAQPICYTYLTPVLFQRAGARLSAPTEENYKEAFTYCDRIPEVQAENRAACFGGFGKEFIVLAREHDVRNVASMTNEEIKRVYTWCNLSMSQSGNDLCLSTALSSMYWGGENDKMGAIHFCEQASGVEQSSCFTRLTGLISYYIADNDYKSSYCNSLPSKYQTDCQKRLL